MQLLQKWEALMRNITKEYTFVGQWRDSKDKFVLVQKRYNRHWFRTGTSAGIWIESKSINVCCPLVSFCIDYGPELISLSQGRTLHHLPSGVTL